MVLANAGIPVLLKETDQAALDRGMASVRKNYQSSVKKGRLTAQEVEERIALIQPQLTYDSFRDADIIIEAVFENMSLKKQVFGEIDRIAKSDCVLATNTSTLDIDEIAGASRRFLHSLETTAPPKNREEEAAKARARAAERFGD